MSEKIVYLMRGLPSCGKSTTARKLAGATGVICETDEFFHTQVGDDPTRFDYRDELMDQARAWNLQRFKEAIARGVTPIVVDRGNSRSLESQVYARYALDHGYEVQLAEPESEWWQEIRVLLKWKHLTEPALDEWAVRLSKLSRQTHRVPASVIRDWMSKWKWDLTVQDILDYEPPERRGVIKDSAQGGLGEAAIESSALDQPPNDTITNVPEQPGQREPSREDPGSARVLQPGQKSPFL